MSRSQLNERGLFVYFSASSTRIDESWIDDLLIELNKINGTVLNQQLAQDVAELPIRHCVLWRPTS